MQKIQSAATAMSLSLSSSESTIQGDEDPQDA